jgi:hypothetical protein
MSATHSLPAPRRWFSRKTLGWILGSAAVAAAITLATIALWPASETEKARDNGEAVGTAVNELYNAQSSEEADVALGDLHDALQNTREDAADYISGQVSDQTDALDRAVDGFVGVHTSDNDSWDQDLYQSELDTAVDDLNSQANDFRSSGPEIQQAFWDGYQTGMSS